MSQRHGVVSAGARGRRADAERNYAAILAAAAVAFAEHGAEADVREIARRSGVGMGTLYRHFPAKEDLLRLTLERQFEQWLADAHEQATATHDPWQALSGFFEQMLTTQAHNRALMDSYVRSGGPTAACAAQSRAFIDNLRIRCDEAGLLRRGISTDDLVTISTSLCHVVQNSDDGRQWRRLMAVSLDGLSRRHQDPLPD